MQIPDEVRKCVVMLSFVNQNGEPKFAGTAFFVSYKGENEYFNSLYPQAGFIYLITARHVLEKSYLHSSDKKIIIRVNTKEGGPALEVLCPIEHWKFHSGGAKYDVAALSWRPDQAFDFLPVGVESFANDLVIHKDGIGIGTELFITGIFRSHLGRHRNVPVLRTGTIAAMPEEPILTEHLGAINGYLAEVRSVGGLSGSPVFAYFRGLRPTNLDLGASPTLAVNWIRFYLLGFVHGHWDIGKEKIDAARDKVQNEEINVGITIVIEARLVFELLNHDDFVEQRKEVVAQMLKENYPVMDSSDKQGGHFSRDDFQVALSRVSRRVDEPDEGKS